MLKFFPRVSVDHYRQIVVVVIIIFSTIGVILYWFNSQIMEQVAVTLTQRRMLTLAKAGAQSVEGSLLRTKLEVINLAEKGEIVDLDLPKARNTLLKTITTNNRFLFKQAGLISKDGILLTIVNTEGNRTYEGSSLTDMQYFQWAKTAKKGEAFISQPLIDKAGINQNQQVIIVATPIINNKRNFAGVLYVPLRLAEMTENYINNLKISPDSRAYVLNQDGIMINSPYKNLVGVNIRDYIQKRKWQDYQSALETVETMIRGEEGMSIYSFLSPEDELTRMVSGFTSAKIDGKKIIIAVATPYSEIYESTKDFLTNQVIWLSFLILTGVVIALLWIVSLFVAKRDGYNQGLKDGARFEARQRGHSS